MMDTGSSAILLVNLGSPDSPSVPDVRRYLGEFLMDERVIDSPWLIRWLIVHLAILPFRPKVSAHAYKMIWQADGSPLIVMSRRLQQFLQKNVTVPVELAMRYGNPSIPDMLKRMMAGPRPPKEILLVPLYPHYAASSYETVVVKVRECLADLAPDARLTVLPPFYDDPRYIAALKASAAPYLAQDYDRLLISFHGIPVRHLKKSDPTGSHCEATDACCAADSLALPTCYRAQCLRTARALTREAAVPDERWSVSFQSRLGREPWLAPYTDHELARFAKAGVKRILVICPAFVADCLETLEEINIRGREIFMSSGGESFTMIPCLNDHPAWEAALLKMISDTVPNVVSDTGIASG